LIDPMISSVRARLQSRLLSTAHAAHGRNWRDARLASTVPGFWSGCDDRLGNTVMAYGKWNDNN
jgi:hypothetical protein